MSIKSRREFLAATTAGALLSCGKSVPRIDRIELLPVRATERTVWLFVRVHTSNGLSGLGEASDAFGFQNTTKQNADTMRDELQHYFAMVEGKPPDVNAYRALGRERARTGGLVSATAFSAIEQTLWDLSGQLSGMPAASATRATLPVYANINRATQPRTPEGFAATAKRAYDDGFRAFKAAPFDGFPAPGSPAKEIEAATDRGIAAMEAIRAAVGPDAQIMVDCHSFFDVPRAIAVAKRLEPMNLTWYEEPVAPERTAETGEIRSSIKQAMAGGEVLFGVEGFTPLCTQAGINVIMPDVKHCGGLLEMIQIASFADGYDVAVAPHNPSGPVATAASVQLCGSLLNFDILELQWGEVPWRSEIVDPPEVFTNGTIAVSGRPGFGIKLNEKLVRKYAQ